MSHMYDKNLYKRDVTCSWPPSSCHKLSHFLGSPLEHDVLYGRPLSCVLFAVIACSRFWRVWAIAIRRELYTGTSRWVSVQQQQESA